MPTLNNLQDKINQLNAEAAAIVLAIAKKIDEFPDNPNIQRVGGGNAFTMSSSDLNRNKSLRPEDYDYKWQYRRIRDFLIENPNNFGIDTIRQVVNQGYFFSKDNKLVTTWTHKVSLGKEVIENLKTIL